MQETDWQQQYKSVTCRLVYVIKDGTLLSPNSPMFLGLVTRERWRCFEVKYCLLALPGGEYHLFTLYWRKVLMFGMRKIVKTTKDIKCAVYEKSSHGQGDSCRLVCEILWIRAFVISLLNSNYCFGPSSQDYENARPIDTLLNYLPRQVAKFLTLCFHLCRSLDLCHFVMRRP